MLGSGFSISLIAYNNDNILLELYNILPMALVSIQLKIAAGQPLSIIEYIQIQVYIANVESSVLCSSQ